MAKVETFRGFPKPVVKKNTKGEPRALLAYVKVHGKQFAKEFPLSTRASAILAWQEEEYARRETQLGSNVLRMPGPFAHDVERYLDLPAVLDMPSFGSRSCDIRAWIPQFERPPAHDHQGRGRVEGHAEVEAGRRSREHSTPPLDGPEGLVAEARQARGPMGS